MVAVPVQYKEVILNAPKSGRLGKAHSLFRRAGGEFSGSCALDADDPRYRSSLTWKPERRWHPRNAMEITLNFTNLTLINTDQ